MIEPQQLADCRQMLRTVAPELDPYVIDAAIVADLPRPPGCCLGWAPSHRFFDLNVCDRLGDQYEGPKPLIVLDCKRIEAESAPGQFHRALLTVVLHEGAHQLPASRVVEAEDSEFARFWQVRAMSTACAKLAQPEPEIEPGGEDDPHDWRFIRRCVHLFYRALMAGYDVPSDLLFGPQLWLARTEVYLMLLLPECARIAGETFATIEATEPPARFREQWEADLEFYNRRFCSRAREQFQADLEAYERSSLSEVLKG